VKARLILLLCALAVLLSACGYWVVEEDGVQVGNPVVQSFAAE